MDEPSDRDHPNTPLCATGRFVYTVDVPAAAVLRVAVDHPWRGDSAILAVDGPGGLTQRTDDGFSAEIVLTDPAPGRWEITAELGIRGRPSHLRLRVAVQEEPGYRPRVWPNLRAMPPYEFGLDAPLVHTNVFAVGDGLNPRGPEGVGCTADETVERGVVNCLRFSTGPMNAGEGDLDVEFDVREDVVERPVRQWLRDSLGIRRERRPAGTYEFHVTHAHYHYADLMRYELYRVRDAETGELELVGEGHKSGFCTVDQGLAEWEEVHAVPNGRAGGNCGLGNPGSFGLSGGWADVYRWQRNGQYVDLGLFPEDGRYVVRAIVDGEDWILESNETDNVAYAHIELDGRIVTTLERGLGTDPWDPDKELATDGRW